MYIFLDIDGVLVKEDPPGYKPDLDEDFEIFQNNLQFDAECYRLFEEVILKHNHARIVISSSWIEIWSLDFIKTKFSSLLINRVVGATPRERGGIQFFRYYEVLDYLQQQGQNNVPWVAIDDFAEHFPSTAPVIVTNCYHGFRSIDAEKLDYFLQYGNIDPYITSM